MQATQAASLTLPRLLERVVYVFSVSARTAEDLSGHDLRDRRPRENRLGRAF